MNKNIWDIKSKIYKYRSKSVFGKILYQENNAIEKMLVKEEKTNLLILDLAAGLGNAANFFSENKCQVVSLDFSKKMLMKNRKNHGENYFINANVTKIPIKDDSIDFIMAIGIMEYLQDKELLLQEISRVLKNGRKGVITFSPKNIFTYLRYIWGNIIYSSNQQENKELLSGYFVIVNEDKTFMQTQYLIKKP